jgi:predicted ATPase/DNA-binding CsgD family transcriptional regulator
VSAASAVGRNATTIATPLAAADDERLRNRRRTLRPLGPPTPSNLPLPLTSFVGRARELNAIRSLLATERLVSLVGPGGIGKSRLALETAQRSLRSFADGVWYVDLSGVADVGQVELTIVEALGVRQTPPLTPIRVLVEAIGRRRMLLVLDDCERHVDVLSPLVAALLEACPDLRIMATTRQRLAAAGEVIYDVPGLATDPRNAGARSDTTYADAAALFVARLGAYDSTFALTERSARLVSDLCERLDGMPLAIELAAARARHFELEDLVARLSDQPALLRGGPRTAPSRQRSLAATVDWSLDSVSAAARGMFAILGVFRGGFDLDAARAVVGESAGDPVEPVLLELVDESLVRRDVGVRGRTRYRLLEPLRQVAVARHRAKGDRSAVDERHARHYANVAGPAREVDLTSLEPVWLDVVQSEHDNLRAALGWLIDKDADRALELAADLGQFWCRRGYMIEGRAWLDRCLAAATTSVHRDRALLALAMIVSIDDDQAAIPLARTALELAVAHHHPAVESAASVWLTLFTTDDMPTARQAFAQATDAARRSGRPELEIAVLGELADLEWLRGEQAAGLEHAREALAAARTLAAPSLAVVPASILARASAWAGRSDAEALFVESLEAARDLGDVELTGYCLGWLAIHAAWRGDNPAAVELLRDGADAYRRTGSRIGKLHVVEQTGLLLISVGRQADGLHLITSKRRLEGDWLDSPQWTTYVNAEVQRAHAAIGKNAAGTGVEEEAPSVEDAFVEAERALSLVASLAGPNRATEPDRLTRRESEVAQLTARGLTNREIGHRLTISERTAEAHVQHILNKLSLSNRAQIAAWAVTQGLT